jgi:NADP-reducing hydrogenase subunit HndB
MREGEGGKIRVVVGMATCGIAAGARPVMTAFLDEISKRNLQNVVVIQTGCIGMCKLEPIVDIIMPGEDKVTYVKVTPEIAIKIINDHIVNKNIISEYTIGSAE